MKQPQPGQPISLCCNAIMNAQRSKCGNLIDYIFCSKCLQHIDQKDQKQIDHVYKAPIKQKT